MNAIIDAVVFALIVVLAGVGIQILHAMIEYPAAAFIVVVCVMAFALSRVL
jgi:hypothetical protein